MAAGATSRCTTAKWIEAGSVADVLPRGRKAELDRALESRPEHPFAITWHPFRLDPQMPAAGMDHVAYLKMKFGDEKGILAAMKPVMAASERLGLWINPSLIERMPNTLNAHRLLYWAGLEGAQTPVMSGLMRAFWREGQNIANPDTLVAIGCAMAFRFSAAQGLCDAAEAARAQAGIAASGLPTRLDQAGALLEGR